jgi:hypothetical protein
MVDHLMIQHDVRVVSREALKPGEVAPGHLAVVELVAARPRALGTLVEIAQISVRAQLANLV